MNLSDNELEEYFRKILPIMYANNGVTVGADVELKCWYLHTTKYRIDWFWAGQTFRVFDQNSNDATEIFSSPISGDLSTVCHMDDGAVLYCDAEAVDTFVERLLGVRVFQ